MVEKANPGSVSLALLRLKAGLSQTQLAEKLGTKQGNVSRWENEPADIRAGTIKRLAEALQVKPETIFEIVMSASVGETVET